MVLERIWRTEKFGLATLFIARGTGRQRHWDHLRLDHGRLHWLAIHPDWQGRGLAKPLISAALTLLAQHHDSAYLMTQIERQAAIHLYQKFGFEPVIDPPEPIALNP